MNNNFILKEKDFDASNLKNYESLMCRGNGYLCVRGSLEEQYIEEKRGTFVNGVFDAVQGEVSELAALPEATNIDIYADGERLDLNIIRYEDYSRTLDMKTGEMIRNFVWVTRQGKRIKIKFSSFVSLNKKHIFANRIVFETDECDVNIKIVTGIDGKITNTGASHFLSPIRRVYDGGVCCLYAKTIGSGVDVAVHYVLDCDTESKVTYSTDRRSIFSTMEFVLRDNAVVDKITSYATSRDCEYISCDTDENTIKADGLKYLETARKTGYDELFSKNRTEWDKYWSKHNDVICAEDDFYDRALKFALYHLNIMSSSEDNRVGIGAKALSGEGYKGHSFWDTEMFILPYFIFNEPKTARNLLEYRYKLLDCAKEKAKKYGFKGAMYPWEGAWTEDGETCPEYGDLDLLTGEVRKNLMGEIEVHISADIAYAVWQYYNVTGDTDFMEKCGCEMILLTAVFWCSRVTECNGRFEIKNVIGPDEYKDDVDNNTYTNYMAHYNLTLLEKIKDIMPEHLKSKYDIEGICKYVKKTADKLYLPKANADGIIPSFDGYFDLKCIDTSKYKNKNKVGLIFNDYGFSEIQKMQVAKQADLMMLFYLMPEIFNEKIIAENYDYHEERTLHDSSLSMCIHSLVAARIHKLDEAETMYKKACGVDLDESLCNSNEGVHSASIGGIWLALAMGFGGLKVDENTVSLAPVLPKGWDGYSFNLTYHNTVLRIAVDEKGCNIERIDGNEIEVNLNGNIITV